MLKKDLNIEIEVKVDRKRNGIQNQEIAIAIVKKNLKLIRNMKMIVKLSLDT